MMLSRAYLSDDLARSAFTDPYAGAGTPPKIGAEVELIPVDETTRKRRWIMPFLRQYGAREGWSEYCTSKGSPCFDVPLGGIVTFEPGGQIEYSTPPMRSAGALLDLLQRVIVPLRAAAAAEGIALLAVGIDPYNAIEQVPLMLHVDRYERMTEYFAQRHPAGARMMRQTAAFQVSLDMGDAPWLRWRVLNAAAPYFLAIFANSPVYAGELTMSPSARATVWRALDPLRTGMPYDEERPVQAYLDFALGAPAMLLPTVDGRHRSFGEWLDTGTPTVADWHEHLSTLFPEVRPRGHFELRSCDAVSPMWYAAPVALAVGLTYAPEVLHAAIDVLGRPDAELLERAGRLGLRDPAIAWVAAGLTDLALEGCASLGSSYFPPADLERARAFFDNYTRRGRAPADDVRDAPLAA